MVALAQAYVRLRPTVDEKEFIKAGQEAGKVFGKGAGSSFADGVQSTLQRAATKLGETIGSEFAKGFNEKIKEETGKAPVGPDRARTRKEGKESAGSYADSFRRQLEQASRSLPPLTVGVAKTAAEQAIRDIQGKLRELGSKTVGVDIDAGAAVEKVRALQEQLQELAANNPDIQVQADTTAALAQLGRITAEADKLNGKDVHVEVNVDTDKATRGVNSLATNLSGGLGKLFSGLSGTASTFFTSLSQGAANAGGQITTSVVSAAAGTATLTAATGGLNLVVGVAATALLGLAAAVAAVTVGMFALAPALSVVGGLLGASIGLFTGVAAAALTLKLGLGGIGEAYSSMVTAQDAASKSSASFAGAQNAVAAASDQVKSALAAQANTRANLAEAAKRAAEQIKAAQVGVAQAEREAVRQVADAQRSLAQARQEAAQQARDGAERVAESIRRVRDAQDTLTAAERSALDVRKELTRAQQEARENLEDLASQSKTNALDQRQAAIDVADARKRLADLQATANNPKASAAQRKAAADQIEAARIAYEREVQQQEDLRRRGKRLAAEQADATKKGIQGSDQVVAVRKRIADADKGIVDARRGVRDAEDDVAKAQRDAERQRVAGVQRVAAAERAVDDARVAGQERVAAAERTLAQARAAQSSQQRAAAYQLAQAAQSVVSAQRALGQASTQAGVAGGEALANLNNQMSELSPNAQKLVRTLFGLRTPFQEIRKFVSDRLLDGVNVQVQTLAERWFPALRTILGDLAGRLNVIGDGLFKALGNQTFIDNITIATRGFGDMLSRIGASLPGVVDAFGRIGAASTPVLRVIGDLIGRMFDKFSAFIKKADETGKLDDFFEGAAKTLQQIFDIGGQVFTIIGKVFKILFPQSKEKSQGFLDGVQDTLDKISKWLDDPKNQQKIRDFVDDITEFVEVATTEWIPKVAGWIDKVDEFFVSAGDWITRVKFWAGVFTGLGGTIVMAWSTIRDKAFNPLKKWVTETVPNAFSTGKDKVVGFFGTVRDKLVGVWNGIRDNVFNPIKNWVTVTVPNAFASLKTKAEARFIEMRNRLGAAWGAIRDNTLGKLKTFIDTTLPNAFSSGRDKLAARFGEARDRIAGIWNSIRDKTFGALKTAITTTVPNAFKTGADAIKAAWKKVEDAAKTPVRFVIDTVVNKGLVGAFNKVAGVFPGVDPIKPFALPKGFATGGVLPGYTPGRDVHQFSSATGGRLALSGGEAVMRPEWTRVVGAGAVDAMNRAARTGGVAGVRRAMGYARGGILGQGDGIGDTLGNLFRRARGKANDIITGAKSLITDPAGAVKTLVDKLIGLVPGQGSPFTQLALGLPRKLLSLVTDRFSGLRGSPGSAGLSGPGNGKSPFGGSAGMMRALRAVFPGLPLISGFRPGAKTLNGNPSYHGADRAVDLPPREDVAKFIHDAYGNITKELITPFQKYNLHNGRKHTYTGDIWRQHNFAGGNAHDHWAAKYGGIAPKFKLFDTGGAWPTGTIGMNTSGRTEWVDPNRSGAGMADVVDALERVLDAILGDGDRLVAAQRVGTARAARVARAAR